MPVLKMIADIARNLRSYRGRWTPALLTTALQTVDSTKLLIPGGSPLSRRSSRRLPHARQQIAPELATPGSSYQISWDQARADNVCIASSATSNGLSLERISEPARLAAGDARGAGSGLCWAVAVDFPSAGQGEADCCSSPAHGGSQGVLREDLDAYLDRKAGKIVRSNENPWDELIDGSRGTALPTGLPQPR